MKALGRKLSLAAASLAVVATAIGVSADMASASIPDSGGNIHGCYNNYLGSLRVIDSSTSSCNSDETSLNWGQSAASSVYTVSDSSGTIGNNTVSCDSSSDKAVGFGYNGIVPSDEIYPSSSYQYTFEDQYGGGTFYLICLSAG